MKLAEIETRLKDWQCNIKAIDDQYNAFADLTGCMPDCKLFDAVFRMTDTYTKAVGEIVGDKGEWLVWYQFENDFGIKALSASIGDGRPEVVENLKQLARLIAGK